LVAQYFQCIVKGGTWNPSRRMLKKVMNFRHQEPAAFATRPPILARDPILTALEYANIKIPLELFEGRIVMRMLYRSVGHVRHFMTAGHGPRGKIHVFAQYGLFWKAAQLAKDAATVSAKGIRGEHRFQPQ